MSVLDRAEADIHNECGQVTQKKTFVSTKAKPLRIFRTDRFACLGVAAKIYAHVMRST